MAAPKIAPKTSATMQSGSWPNMCRVQTDIGLIMPTTIEGIMDSMEPSSGATQNAINIWTNMAATIPTVQVTAKFQPSWCMPCMTTVATIPTAIKKKKSPIPNKVARDLASGRENNRLRFSRSVTVVVLIVFVPIDLYLSYVPECLVA